MRHFLRSFYGSICIVIAAACIGLSVNALRSDGLPLIRKPLRETRAFASKATLMSKQPIQKPSPVPAAHGMSAAPSAPAKVSSAVSVQPAVEVAKAAAVEEKAGGNLPVANIVNTVKTQTKSTPKKIEALFTTLDDAKALFDKKAATFVDSRPIEDYEAEHISGAVSLYCENIDELYDKTLGSVAKDQLIITFCSDPECKEAIKLADALVARGHTRVVILLEGLPGWKDAGYPTVSGKEH